MEQDFDFFYKWAKSKLNIELDAYKENQLQRRITTVMKSSGATNLKDYAELISKDQQIKRIFLDYITINVTEFFRNKEIFDEFELVIKNVIIPKFKSIKIWSAACSVGAEPYSLAIMLDRNNFSIKEKIVATDIDDTILKKAQNGVFREHEIKNLSKNDLDKYFSIKDDSYSIKDSVKSMVAFKKHDLILDKYEQGFHAVICRNVTIYFKNDAKNEIYRKIHDSLVPGGIFFTGATESIYNPKELGFKKLSTFIYEKV
ncbi:chemotaxis protein CheR [Alkalibaculum sp. M08DMB]|uniref:protein-glutamate O-methyltransferase n=1 Tax=Alkalibaculum sporogenes TaxID=2655001 RepID=A0A6A7K5R2_9FIRM|nr:protein-glutamate O-methyltransferase CheR [Alkalibaculum sporogenes]MPW24758.1 chemotaxis protein CheR [Alkalibaculum sporogenes]